MPTSVERKINPRLFCLFVGSARSGHTLVRSLLDAHPHIVLGNEVNVFHRYQGEKWSRQKLFSELVSSSRGFHRLGDSWTGYSYAVKGHSQGETLGARVVGDKQGAATASSLSLVRSGGRNVPWPAMKREEGSRPVCGTGLNRKLLEEFKAYIVIPLKFIYVVRDPFRQVSSMLTHAREVKFDPEDIIANFFNQTTIANAVCKLEPTFVVHLEDFMKSPQKILGRMCKFLDVEAEERYLEACSSIVKNRDGRPIMLQRRYKNMISYEAGKHKSLRRYL